MKKLFVAAILAALCVFSVAAVDITKPASEISLPDGWILGKWYDAKWDAYWEIGNNTIKIYKGDDLVINFEGKVKDFALDAGLNGVTMSWACESTNRTYAITKPIALDTDLHLVVERNDVPDSDPNKKLDTTIVRR